MLKALYSHGRFIPVFVCDHCGKIIRDALQAIEVCADEAIIKDGQFAQPYHVHKGQCDELFQKTFGDTVGSWELSVYIAELAQNTGMGPADIEDAAAIPKQMDQI